MYSVRKSDWIPPTSCTYCGKKDCLKKVPAVADVHLKGGG